MLTAPFPDEFARRRERFRALISTGPAPVDAFVVSDLTNIRYLSGFTGSNAALSISAAGSDGDRICTDGRYLTQVAEQSGDLVAIIARNCTDELIGAAIAAGASRVGFESDVLTVAAHANLTGGLGQGVNSSDGPDSLPSCVRSKTTQRSNCCGVRVPSATSHSPRSSPTV